MQANITDKHKCKNTQQSITKLNSTVSYKVHMPWFSSIYQRKQRSFNICKSLWFTTLTNWIKSYGHFNWCRKSFWQNLASVYNKTSPESGNRSNMPKHNKGLICPYNQQYTQLWNAENTLSKIRNKISLPTPTAFIEQSIESFNHNNYTRKRNESNPN